MLALEFIHEQLGVLNAQLKLTNLHSIGKSVNDHLEYSEIETLWKTFNQKYFSIKVPQTGPLKRSLYENFIRNFPENGLNY